jgi:hypothetical protein
MSLSSLFGLIRNLFAPVAAPAPAPVADPAPAPKPKLQVYASIYRTRGNKRELVGGLWCDRKETAFDTVLALQLSSQVLAGESVAVDGARFKIRANARPTLMDPAPRNRAGDRKRFREELQTFYKG